MQNKYEIQSMSVTYDDLTSRKNNKSEVHYMISEFIDNSIGSWEEFQDDNKILNISIEINLKDSFIKITDDAKGMSQKKLEDSIRLNKKTDGNKMHKFGVGMKNAAFWLAQDIYVWTKKDGNNNGFYTYIESSNKNGDEIVKWRCEDDYRHTNRGTMILLKNLIPRSIAKNKIHNVIISFLSMKFNHHLEKNLNLSLDVTYKNGEHERIKIEQNKIEPQIIEPEDLNNFIKNVNDTFKFEPKKLINLKSMAIENAKNNLPLEFKFVLKINDNIAPVELLIGVQRQNNGKDDNTNFKRNYGLGLTQNKRYINIPNYNVKELGEYIRSDIKRAFALIELGDHEKWFTLDNNKQSFNFNEYEEEFEEFIKNIGDDFTMLCTAVKNTIVKKKKVNTNNDFRDFINIKNSLNSKCKNSEFKFTDVNRDSVHVQMKTDLLNANGLFHKNELYEIYIYEEIIDNNDENIYFIKSYLDNGLNNKISIHYNLNHILWKPITEHNNNVELKSMLYSIVATVGLYMLFADNTIYSKNNIQDSNKLKNDFSNLIDEIANKLGGN